jgi:hypothetical protein
MRKLLQSFLRNFVTLILEIKGMAHLIIQVKRYYTYMQELKYQFQTFLHLSNVFTMTVPILFSISVSFCNRRSLLVLTQDSALSD